ncbi:hypothetical protein GEMRC1_011211 [Eukaryota sp. GEM-RC1]
MTQNVIGVDFGTFSIKINGINPQDRVDPVLNERGEGTFVNLLQRNGKKFLFGSRVLSKLRLRSHKSLLGPQVILSRSNVPLSQYLLSGHQKDSNTFTLDNTNFSLHDILVEIFKYLKPFIPNVDSSKVFFSYSPLFNDHHSALTNAASEAGLNLGGVFPSSKCIAASLLFKHPQLNDNIGVFDFGYSTTKFTAFSIKNGSISILFDEEMAMGARDFDDVILNYFVAQKPRFNFSTCDLIEILENIQNLRNFFGVESLSFDIPFGSETEESIHFKISVDELTTILSEKLNLLTDRFSNYLKYSINSIVVVGGFSNCPLIEQLINQIFSQKVKRILNPFTDVSVGCCLLGNGFGSASITDSPTRSNVQSTSVNELKPLESEAKSPLSPDVSPTNLKGDNIIIDHAIVGEVQLIGKSTITSIEKSHFNDASPNQSKLNDLILPFIHECSSHTVIEYVQEFSKLGFQNLADRKRFISIKAELKQFNSTAVFVKCRFMLNQPLVLINQSYTVENGTLNFEVDLGSIHFQELLKNYEFEISFHHERCCLPFFNCMYSHRFLMKSLLVNEKYNHRTYRCSVSLILSVNNCK